MSIVNSAADITAQINESNASGAVAPTTLVGRVDPQEFDGVDLTGAGAANAPVTNAIQFVPNSDTGTDAETITVAESQYDMRSNILTDEQIDAMNSDRINTINGTSVITDVDSAIGPTVGTYANDDNFVEQDNSAFNGQTFGTTSTQYISNQTASFVREQANILDRFASYSYTISIYILSPADLQNLVVNRSRQLPSSQLLFQSAGAPNQQTADLNLDPGRNQFFPLDYYIDNVEVQSLCPGKGTAGAHNVTKLKFNVTENNGITLLDNLYKATQNYITFGNTDQNYSSQNFLMVIRWYGYDKNGIIMPAYNPFSTDTQAIAEKFIPFQFTRINFRIANKLIEYTCEAVAPQNNIASGTGRGTIPANIELQGRTLNDVVNGNSGGGATNAFTNVNDADRGSIATQGEPAAPAAGQISQVNGLMAALNEYQQQLVSDGTYGVADQYDLIFSHPELEAALMKPPGETVRQTTPMVDATTGQQQIDPTRQNLDPLTKTVSATAGKSIIKFLDEIVRQSTYIYNQQTRIIGRDGTEKIQNTGQKNVAWYRIGMQAVPIAYDPKRNDYAYRITYEIAPYGVNNMVSDYFPAGQYRGSHKNYKYWFTGENTAVLKYEQDFNYLYFLTINGSNLSATTGTSNYREIQKRLYQRNSAQSSQGVPGDQNEPGANAADFLYSPADQAKVELEIIGDPAWIGQGELWSGLRSNSNANPGEFFDGFLPDGTINYDAREALFEINFKKPSDYNIRNGLLAVDPSIDSMQTYVYKAYEIVSHFKRGQFTQDLKGVLLVFPTVEEFDYLKEYNTLMDNGGIDTVPNDDDTLRGADETVFGVAVDNFTEAFTGTGVSTFTQQSPGSARAIGQRGFNQAGDEFNALDAIAENNQILGLNPDGSTNFGTNSNVPQVITNDDATDG
jgi:hypothetical protein